MIVQPKIFKRKIDRSLKFLDRRKTEAERFIRAYTGDYNERARGKLDENKDEMSVNFIFSFVETIGPTVFSGDPKMYLDPKNQASEKTAPYLQALTNYWIRELGLWEYFMLCRFDSFFSHCAFQTEWEYEDRLVEKEVPATVPLTNSPIVNPFTGKPVMVNKKMREVTKDQPLAKRISPWNAIIDADAENRREDRYRAIRWLMTKSEFDKLDGVGSRVKKNVKAGRIPRDMMRPPFASGDDAGDSEEEWVTLFKIYDLANEKVLLLPDYGSDDEDKGDFIEEKDWPWFFEVEGDPWPLTIHESKHDPANPYSMSEFKAYWAQIQERNRLRVTIQSHTRRLVMGWLMKTGAMDEEQKKKFVEAKIGELCEANKPEDIMARPNPTLPREFFEFDAMSERDLVNVSGFNEYSYESTSDTATEASIIQGRSNIRKGDRKESFGRFKSKVGGKIAQLIQQYHSVEQAVKIRKPESPQELMWANATKENIQGEFDWTMKEGVTQYEDEALMRQQTLKTAELLGNNPHTDQRKLAAKLAKVVDEDPDDILRPEAEVKAEQEAMANAGKAPQQPPLGFDKIKWELLPPEIQAVVLQAALQQNGATPDGSMEGGAPGGPPETSSLTAPPWNSVMPGAEMNQAPAMFNGQDLPPATPVQPASEFQGG